MSSLIRLIVLALLVVCPLQIPAVEPEPPAEAAGSIHASGASVALAHRMQKLKTALQKDDEKALALAIQDVEILRRDFGTLDVSPLVESAAIWALEQGREGQVERGLKALRMVEHWDPRHPTLVGARITLLRQRGLMGYVEGLPDVIELSRVRLMHPVHRSLFIIHHVAWVRVLVTTLLLGWALVLALRYRRVFRYLWEEPLGKLVPHAWVRALLGAFLLSLPVIAGLDPALCAMAWLWLLVPFLQGHELRTALLVILLQVVHPLLALLEPAAIHATQPSIETIQLRPHWKRVDWSAVKGLSEGDRTYLQGWEALQDQSWKEAEPLFSSLVKRHPDQVGVLNNLGVSLFQQGRVEEAERCFEQAEAKGSPSTELLLNQSILAYRRLDSTLGAQKQDEARKSAPERYVQLRDASQARTEQRTFAMPLPDAPERQEVLSKQLGSQQPPRGGHWGAGALLWTILPLGAAGLLLMRARQSLREAHPTQCLRCGEAFHTTDSPEPEVCSKCHHLFVLKDGLHGDSRKTKVDEAATFQTQQRWLHRVLLVVVPGLDLVFLGQSRAGFLEFSLVALAASMVLGSGRLMRYPGEVLPDPASLWLPLGFGLLGLFYLRSWLKLVLRRG